MRLSAAFGWERRRVLSVLPRRWPWGLGAGPLGAGPWGRGLWPGPRPPVPLTWSGLSRICVRPPPAVTVLL